MPRDIFLVFRTPTLLVTDINVTFLYAGKKIVFGRISLKIYGAFLLSFLLLLTCCISKINSLCDRI